MLDDLVGARRANSARFCRERLQEAWKQRLCAVGGCIHASLGQGGDKKYKVEQAGLATDENDRGVFGARAPV
jgi:hypothetical protein